MNTNPSLLLDDVLHPAPEFRKTTHAYIYGAGGNGQGFYHLLRRCFPHITVCGFVSTFDNGHCLGLPLLALQDFTPEPEAMTIICSAWHEDIAKALEARGIVNYARFVTRHCRKEISICITNRCNTHCHFCNYTTHDAQHDMSMDTFHALLPYFDLHDDVVISGGGEPLLHPRIEDMVRQLHDAGKHIHMVTNGKALLDENIRARVVPMLHKIILSMTSPHAEVQQEVMPGIDPKAILAVVKDIQAQGGPKVVINTVLTRQALSTLPELLTATSAADVDTLGVTDLFYLPDAPRVDSIRPCDIDISTPEKKRAVEDLLRAVRHKGRTLEFPVAFQYTGVKLDLGATDTPHATADSAAPTCDLAPRHAPHAPAASSTSTRLCHFPWFGIHIEDSPWQGQVGNHRIHACCNGYTLSTTAEGLPALHRAQQDLQTRLLEGRLDGPCVHCRLVPQCTHEELMHMLKQHGYILNSCCLGMDTSAAGGLRS